MKKYSWLIALVAIFTLALAGFVSCRDDDGGNGNGGQQNGADNVTITFDANGGVLDGSATVTIPRNATVAETAAPTATRNGWTFIEWNTDGDGDGTALVYGSTAHAADTKYYAVWDEDPLKITLNAGAGTFTGGIGSGTATRVVNVSKGGVISNIPTDVARPDYDFHGWFTQLNGAGTQLTNETVHNDDATFHAYWQPEAPVKVLWDMQDCPWVIALDGIGGSEHSNNWLRTAPEAGVNFEVVVDAGSGDVTLILPTRTGSSQGIRMSLAGMIHAANDVIRSGYVYKIEYAGNLPTADRGRFRLESGNNPLVGGASPDSVLLIQAANSSNFDLTLYLTENQISFMNTSTSAPTSANRGTEISLGTAGNVPLEYTNVVITRYKPNVEDGMDTVDVTFNAGEGTLPGGFFGGGSTSSINIVEGARAFAIPTPTRDGHLFMGWFTEADGEGSQLTAATTHGADTTYFAYWEAGMTITFDANGGAFTGGATTWTKDVFMDAPFPFIPLHVTRADQQLVRWNTQADGNGTNLDTTTNLTAAATYFAIWQTAGNETIIFDLKRDWDPAWSPTGNLNSYLIRNSVTWVFDQYSRNITTSGTKTGTSQGLRFTFNADFHPLIKADHTYRIEYSGVFAPGFPANERGRFRLDSGGTPSAVAGTPTGSIGPIGNGNRGNGTMGPATSTVLALSDDVGTTGAYSISFTFTAAEYALMRTGTSTYIGFNHENTAAQHLTLTHVRIVEIAPAE